MNLNCSVYASFAFDDVASRSGANHIDDLRDCSSTKDGLGFLLPRLDPEELLELVLPSPANGPALLSPANGPAGA